MKMGFVLKDIETGETLDYNPADFSALLRVARVAEVLYGGIEAEYHYKGYMTVPDIGDNMGELGKALKEVEHLLEVDDETE